jgi:hypothetical protein
MEINISCCEVEIAWTHNAFQISALTIRDIYEIQENIYRERNFGALGKISIGSIAHATSHIFKGNNHDSYTVYTTHVTISWWVREININNILSKHELVYKNIMQQVNTAWYLYFRLFACTLFGQSMSGHIDVKVPRHIGVQMVNVLSTCGINSR